MKRAFLFWSEFRPSPDLIHILPGRLTKFWLKRWLSGTLVSRQVPWDKQRRDQHDSQQPPSDSVADRFDQAIEAPQRDSCVHFWGSHLSRSGDAYVCKPPRIVDVRPSEATLRPFETLKRSCYVEHRIDRNHVQ